MKKTLFSYIESPRSLIMSLYHDDYPALEPVSLHSVLPTLRMLRTDPLSICFTVDQVSLIPLQSAALRGGRGTEFPAEVVSSTSPLRQVEQPDDDVILLTHTKPSYLTWDNPLHHFQPDQDHSVTELIHSPHIKIEPCEPLKTPVEVSQDASIEIEPKNQPKETKTYPEQAREILPSLFKRGRPAHFFPPRDSPVFDPTYLVIHHSDKDDRIVRTIKKEDQYYFSSQDVIYCMQHKRDNLQRFILYASERRHLMYVCEVVQLSRPHCYISFEGLLNIVQQLLDKGRLGHVMKVNEMIHQLAGYMNSPDKCLPYNGSR